MVLLFLVALIFSYQNNFLVNKVIKKWKNIIHEKNKNPDYQILQMYYSKFKHPKLEKIIENLGNKELLNSEIIEKIFQTLNKDISILTNIEEKQNEMRIKSFLTNQTPE